MNFSKIIFELKFIIQPFQLAGEEIVRRLLIKKGFLDENIIETKKDGYRYLSVYFTSKKKAGRLRKEFLALRLEEVKTKVKVLKKTDWQDRWKDEWKPFTLTKVLDVVPYEFRRSYAYSSRNYFYLKTTLAFGTGLHETTRFMAQLIEDTKGKFQTFFDIGTGSGILSIVAFKCNAQKVCVVDIDKLSIKAARENLKANGLRFHKFFLQDVGRLKTNTRFDYVAANLITRDLIQYRRKLLSFVKKNKYLAISGISRDNLKLIQKEFKALPLRCRRVLKGKEWAAILYKRI